MSEFRPRLISTGGSYHTEPAGKEESEVGGGGTGKEKEKKKIKSENTPEEEMVKNQKTDDRD